MTARAVGSVGPLATVAPCVQARVTVPSDALVGDFVFLDSANEHSGFYDNNNGLDYHVPVTGASGTLPPLRVAHISVEMAPIAKVGGMGDVVTALGRAVQEYGHDVEVRPRPAGLPDPQTSPTRRPPRLCPRACRGCAPPAGAGARAGYTG